MYTINVTKTVTPRKLATPAQKLGAAIGIMICGALLAAVLFYNL
jgi:hypothetical protein